MGYCNFCNTYYKKIAVGDICKYCSRSIVGTPPSINNIMKQFEYMMSRKLIDLDHEYKFKKNATLMDLSANEILSNENLVLKLVNTLPDGNLPWYALLRAWYRKNKKKARHLNAEKYPRDRLLKLLGINLVEYMIDESVQNEDIDDTDDNVYIIFNKDIECLEELEKFEELEDWYFLIDL